MAEEEEGVLSVKMLESVTQDSQAFYLVMDGLIDAVNAAKGGTQEGSRVWVSHLEVGSCRKVRYLWQQGLY